MFNAGWRAADKVPGAWQKPSAEKLNRYPPPAIRLSQPLPDDSWGRPEPRAVLPPAEEGSRFQLSALQRPLGATGATVVDGLDLERTLAALHQHGHQQVFGAGCRAEGVQSRPVEGTTDPMPLCQITTATSSFQEFFQDSNPNRVVRFHPLSPPLPHLLQFPFASSMSPIHLV